MFEIDVFVFMVVLCLIAGMPSIPPELSRVCVR